MESLDLFTVYLLYNKTKFIQGISASFLICLFNMSMVKLKIKKKNSNFYKRETSLDRAECAKTNFGIVWWGAFAHLPQKKFASYWVSLYFKSSWSAPGNIMHEYETKLRAQKLKKAQSKHKKGVVLPETKKVGSWFVL